MTTVERFCTVCYRCVSSTHFYCFGFGFGFLIVHSLDCHQIFIIPGVLKEYSTAFASFLLALDAGAHFGALIHSLHGCLSFSSTFQYHLRAEA